MTQYNDVRLHTPEQGHATVHLRRTQHARRLYRLTGGGLYRDTVLVGGTPPVAEPLLSSADAGGALEGVMPCVYFGVYSNCDVCKTAKGEAWEQGLRDEERKAKRKRPKNGRQKRTSVGC